MVIIIRTIHYRDEMMRRAKLQRSREEFLNKLHSRDSPSISTDQSSRKWQHRSSPNKFGEALSLDNNIDDYRKGLEYEREENAVSEALRLDPNFKLFEIHEADDCKCIINDQ